MLKYMTKFLSKRNTKNHKRSFDKDYNAANAFILLVSEKMEELSNRKSQTANDQCEIETNQNSELTSDGCSYPQSDDIFSVSDSTVSYETPDLSDVRSTNVRERRKLSSCNKKRTDNKKESFHKDIINTDEFPTSTQLEHDQQNNQTETGCTNQNNSKECISRNNSKSKGSSKVDYSWLFDTKNIPRMNRFDRGKLRECCQLMTYDQSLLAYDVLQKLIEDISDPSVIPHILDNIILHILEQDKESASFVDIFRRRNLYEIRWQGYMRPFALLLSLFFPKRFKRSPDSDRQREVTNTATIIKESLMKRNTNVFVNNTATESDTLESLNDSKDINVVYVQRVNQDRTQSNIQESYYMNHQSYRFCKIDRFYFRNSNNILSNSVYKSQICRQNSTSCKEINNEADFRIRKRVIKRRSQAVTVRVIRDSTISHSKQTIRMQ